jgi:hypothetical protein
MPHLPFFVWLLIAIACLPIGYLIGYFSYPIAFKNHGFWLRVIWPFSFFQTERMRGGEDYGFMGLFKNRKSHARIMAIFWPLRIGITCISWFVVIITYICMSILWVWAILWGCDWRSKWVLIFSTLLIIAEKLVDAAVKRGWEWRSEWILILIAYLGITGMLIYALIREWNRKNQSDKT